MSLRYILNDLELVSPRTLQVAPHKASLFSSIVQASLCFTLYLWVKFGFGQWCTQEFFSGGGSTNSVEDRGQRERGSGGGSPLVSGSGGSCNLVQETSYHIVIFS